jgi:RNA polymerase sigma-70 factor (ECF subfamily)
MDDLALSRAVASGDEEAFRTLVDRSTSRVFRTCYRILGEVHDAEDATQETFVLAYRALATFRGDGSAEGWLVRIATRLCWRRAAQATARRSATVSLTDAITSTIADPADLGSDAVMAYERESVRRSVAALPEPYREVVGLRFFGELSLAEIARVTGRPEATVKTHLYRGLARLRTGLAEARHDRS